MLLNDLYKRGMRPQRDSLWQIERMIKEGRYIVELVEEPYTEQSDIEKVIENIMGGYPPPRVAAKEHVDAKLTLYVTAVLDVMLKFMSGEVKYKNLPLVAFNDLGVWEAKIVEIWISEPSSDLNAKVI